MKSLDANYYKTDQTVINHLALKLHLQSLATDANIIQKYEPYYTKYNSQLDDLLSTIVCLASCMFTCKIIDAGLLDRYTDAIAYDLQRKQIVKLFLNTDMNTTVRKLFHLQIQWMNNHTNSNTNNT